MTAAYAQKTETRWDQSAFDALKATWSPERIAEDEKNLRAVFNLAASVPLLAAALGWATSHGIKFFVDRTLKDAWGYYKPGYGVVGIAEDIAAGSDAVVDTLVHEIRHAWQDYQGFLAWPGEDGEPGDFAAFFINNAMVEADAEAFGRRAKEEYQAAASGQPLPEKNAALADSFLSWYQSPDDTQFYGDHASKLYGQKWGIYAGAQPEHSMEFKAPEPAAAAGINLSDMQDILQLGRGFSGTGNYLARLSPDVLPRQILSPALAQSFYGTATAEQQELTTEIRKAHLQKKLAHKLPGAAP